MMKSYELNVRCSCERYLKVRAKESSNIVITCTDRKCKKDNEIKVVMLSDMVRQRRHHTTQSKQSIIDMKNKLAELDGRTKEAKELKAQIEDRDKYIQQLEGIIDGQG